VAHGYFGNWLGNTSGVWFGATSEPAPLPPQTGGGGGRWLPKRSNRAERRARAIYISHEPSYYYQQIINSEAPKSVKKEAAAVIRPYVEKRAKIIPRVSSVDWQRLADDIYAVQQLFRIWREEVRQREIDEDDEEILMLL